MLFSQFSLITSREEISPALLCWGGDHMAQVVTRGPHEGSDQDEVLEFRLSSGMKLRNQFTTPQIPQIKVPLTPPLPAPFLPSSCHQHSHDVGSDLSNPVSAGSRACAHPVTSLHQAWCLAQSRALF